MKNAVTMAANAAMWVTLCSTYLIEYIDPDVCIASNDDDGDDDDDDNDGAPIPFPPDRCPQNPNPPERHHGKSM